MNTWNILLAAVAVAAPLLSGCDNCDELRSQSKALLQEYAACSGDDACKLVDMYTLLGPENCLGAFQCSQALNSRVRDLEFQERALVVVEDYETCSQCEQASCPDPATTKARCNPTTRQCELYSTGTISDAGVSD